MRQSCLFVGGESEGEQRVIDDSSRINVSVIFAVLLAQTVGCVTASDAKRQTERRFPLPLNQCVYLKLPLAWGGVTLRELQRRQRKLGDSKGRWKWRAGSSGKRGGWRRGSGYTMRHKFHFYRAVVGHSGSQLIICEQGYCAIILCQLCSPKPREFLDLIQVCSFVCCSSIVRLLSCSAGKSESGKSKRAERERERNLHANYPLTCKAIGGRLSYSGQSMHLVWLASIRCHAAWVI